MSEDQAQYYSLDDDNRQKALASLNECSESNEIVYKSNAFSNLGGPNYGYLGRTFDNVTSTRSIKSEYGRSDYDVYRPSEASPVEYEQIIRVCMRAYDRVGIVRNVIDLMGDFTCSGVRLVHPNPKIQKFYREWFTHVNGEQVSERFCNYLYRIANVPVYINYAKLPVKVERKWAEAYGMDFVIPKQESRRIPYSYGFINPINIEVIAPELAVLTNKKLFALKLGQIIKRSLQKLEGNYRGVPTQELIALVPQEIKTAISDNRDLIPLKEENLEVYYYKKDDWDIWAKPIIYSILDDIMELEKMKLADISALDGAISNIRLWRVGIITDNPATCIMPNKAALDKLRSILSMGVGGGTMDLVWGPELDFKESNTQVHQFLGIDKYEPVYHNIYQGMGVPSSMSGKSSGFNNSMVSMQTLIERLKYGRSVLRNFWNEECKKIQLAMGYKSPARVQFSKINFGDENAAMKLLIELYDRNLLTDDDLQESFDFFPEVVKTRLRKEFKDRQKDKLQPKAGPYATNIDDDLRKIILQRGGVAPSEVGLELLPKKEGEKNALELQAELAPKPIAGGPVGSKKPSGPNGRPKTSKDTVQRKKRTPKPNAAKAEFMNLFLWACDAQKKVSELVTPVWVKEVCSKKDVRGLSEEETEGLEYTKFKVLCNLQPFAEITTASVFECINKVKLAPPEMEDAARLLMATFISKNGKEPTTEEKRQIQSSAYALYHESDDINDSEEELNIETVKVIGG